ncbi:phage tail protein [Paenibacillus sp. HJL G12]|uniref:Phage tail protein n=1 Tax=Paenibacillus dendrobii TaxID=2691084 RepID=A0A7X3LEI9_9BACL|nr:tail fiber protein [Paenibacillus dendrobii]MWV42037.1 phage tail protein [Paenibacillus dendrobii]
MADAYVGEIRIFAGNFAPRGWALCNGQLLNVSQNTVLFSILGAQYGGDGRTNFALPNLMGSAPMHQGAGPGLTPRTVGQQIGATTETLTTQQIPNHNHIPQAVDAVGNSKSPVGNLWSQSQKQGIPPHQTQTKLYDATPTVQMSPLALSVAGGSQPHNNMQPFIAQNFIICLEGEYPPRG